jgi:hypothetical protein
MMRPQLLAISAAVATVVLAGCGGDDSSTSSQTQSTAQATSAQTATTGPTDTQATAPADDSAAGGGGTPTAGKKLTDAQREKVRVRARAIADCLRDAGATVTTEPRDIADPIIRAAPGVTLHLTIGAGEADLVVLKSPAAARRTAGGLGQDVTVIRRGRTVVAFADQPGAQERSALRGCL